MIASLDQRFAANKLFVGIEPDTLGRIAAIPEPMECASGTILFNEGDPADPPCLYLVASGSVRVSKRGRGGRQETLSYLETGEFFGEMALYDAQPRSARATVTQPTVLGRIDRASFEQILAMAPAEVSSNLTRQLLWRLRQANDLLIEEVLEAERLSLVGSMAANIIHDFRNPMSTIRSAAEYLDGRLQDPKLARFTRIIRRSVDRMLGMTQELLDFARGTFSIHLQSVSVDALIAELQEEVLDGLPAKIQVEKRIDFHGTLHVDITRFVRMLVNLVKNAVDAMPNGGVCTVAVDARGGDVVFTISDTGGGIPDHVLARLFEPFVTHGKPNGTGLGMAISKSIAEAHGGTIIVHSTAGVGTSLEVVVPGEMGR